jgi:GNAT superfamily N-acetyltransferase
MQTTVIDWLIPTTSSLRKFNIEQKRTEIVKILHWDIDRAGELASVYNDQVTDIPHCYAVSPEEFENGFRYGKGADEPYENFHSEKIIVGEQNGKIVGFADVAVVGISEGERKMRKGLIRFLTYQPGYRPVGQAILEEAEGYLRDMGIDQVSAFRISYHNDYCYRFYHLGFGLISDRKGHIYGLFFMNDYKIEDGEVFMDQPAYKIAEPVIPDSRVEIVLDQNPGRGLLPGLTVQAFREGNEVGVCESVSAGKYCQNEEAQDWVFIKWLGVEEDYRRKGWGRYLLQRNLWEMQKIGYKNTIISANIKNHRAQLFYTNYGYRVADTCYQFSSTAV